MNSYRINNWRPTLGSVPVLDLSGIYIPNHGLEKIIKIFGANVLDKFAYNVLRTAIIFNIISTICKTAKVNFIKRRKEPCRGFESLFIRPPILLESQNESHKVGHTLWLFYLQKAQDF